MRTSAGLGLEQLRQQPGTDVEDQHQQHQGQRGTPGPGLGEVVGRGARPFAELVPDHHRQGRHVTAERVEVDPRGVADQQDQRRGLPGDPGHGQQRRGDQPRHRRRQNDFQDRPPFRHAERVGRLPQIPGHQLQHFLRRPHRHRHHQDGQRDGPGRTERPHPEPEQQEGVDEQAGHDRRHTGHHVDEERHRAGELPAAVLDQIDRGENADRQSDHGGDADDDQRADQRGVDPAALLPAGHAVHRLEEEVRR